MKKIIIICIFLLFSGLSCDTYPTTNLTRSADVNKTNDREFNNLVNNIKNGKEEVPNKTQQINNNSNMNEKETLTFVNLAEKYSRATIKTNYGDITVKFYSEESPVTVNNFLNLAKNDFYDGTKFHRVIKDFMIQGGDPLSKDNDPSNDGRGGPGYAFQDEINSHKLTQGSLAMANAGPNTNGSQFFIVTAQATPWLDGKHTNFGQVISGMDVVQKIEALDTNENDRPITDVVILEITLVE